MFEDNQWDNEEYSDDTEYEYSDDEEYEDDGEYSDDDGEYSDDDEEEYEDELNGEYSEEDDDEEYEDDEDSEYEEDTDEPKKNNSFLIIIIIIILLLLLIGGFLFFSKNGDKAEQKSDLSSTQQTSDSGFFAGDNSSDNSNTMDISFDENGNVNVADQNGENGDVIKVSDVPLATPENGVTASPESENFVDKNLPGTVSEADNPDANDSIMVSYTKAANQNPFKPPVRDVASNVADKDDYIPYAVVDNSRYEVFEPPTTTIQDENLIRLLNTEISGIMYDATSPSAIIKLNNTDYYVKQGDVISGYKIGKITKDSVQVTYKNNTYVASVGELFSKEAVNRHDVANIENKFGGRYRN